jgi:hypothetical protein
MKQIVEQDLDFGSLPLYQNIVVDAPIIELLKFFQELADLGAVPHVVLVKAVVEEIGPRL